VDIQMILDADDPAVAMVKALATLCAAIHAIGDATPLRAGRPRWQ
jgi:hypothetical protein